MPPLIPPESGPYEAETLQCVSPDHTSRVSPFPLSNKLEGLTQHKTGNEMRDTADTMATPRGRKRRHEPTVHGWRFHWLILQLQKEGISQSELARRTGLGVTYINSYANIETSGVYGIGAETVQVMRDRMGLDPRYFFDPHEGERPYTMYLLDAKREAAQLAEFSAKLAEVTKRLAESERRNSTLETSLEKRLAALEAPARPNSRARRSLK